MSSSAKTVTPQLYPGNTYRLPGKWPIVFFGILLAVLLAGVFAWGGLTNGLLMTAVLASIPVIMTAMVNHQFGLSLMLIIGFFVHFLSKYSSAPAGISMDSLLFVMVFGLLLMQIHRRDWSFLNNSISFWVILWVGYNLLQGINPWAESKMAWLFTVRTMALMILVFFIASHNFNSLQKIKNILKLIIFLLLFAALYGLKQEYFGFSAAETNWVYADNLRFQLLFQWTRMRIFSLLNDPTTFGIMMAYGGVFSFILASGPFATWKRVSLLIAGALMLLAMAYTGTRTAYVLVPIGLALFAALTLTKRIMLGAGIVLMLGTLMVLKSTSNPLIYRIQSAFRVTEDESMQVRLKNQKIIQPFIWSHPVGAGLGSTGVWGKRFTPDSWLADFPHDSGFVRIAVEQGWIGLLLYLILLFVVMRTALHYYLRVKDPTIKVLYLAILVVIFMLTVGSYPQEIIVHLPSSLIFYILLAAIVRLKDFDPNFQKLSGPTATKNQEY